METMKTLTYKIRLGRERVFTKGLAALSRTRALETGVSQISSSVTSLPMTMPRCVPLSRRGRSGHGDCAKPDLIAASLEGCEVDRTSDLSLLIPRPETTEKEEIRERAG